MMDHLAVLKRAWGVTWRYQALWVFGVLLALTAGGGRGYGGLQYHFDSGNLPGRGGDFGLPGIPSEVVSALVCLLVILVVIGTIARYVSETALLRLINYYEATGERLGVGQGFRIGWSRSAFRLFLIDLLVGLPLALIFIAVFVPALLTPLPWTTDNTAAGIARTVAAIGLFALAILVVVVAATAISLLLQFFYRACALERLGVIESIRQGFGVVRRHLKDVVIMGLIIVGISVSLALATVPLVFVLLGAGLLVGGLPALLVGGLASLFFEEGVPLILGAVAGLPLFVLVVGLPLLFVGGLAHVFTSSVWTLTYRELCGLEGMPLAATTRE